MPKTKDPEVAEFEAALLRSVDQALTGKHGAVHTPADIKARRPGRPVGTTKADAKVRTTLRLDPEVIDAFKAQGAGWQTKINDLLRADVRAGRHIAKA
ncbi:MAG: hypothetical protein EOO23_00310 [Comamonadaceae bacterium]|nr:MAG: hypothetical protein EOO23_00310 [Comamonadaceae bacterium]